jgi:tRNA pseudouridine38-40 synthase
MELTALNEILESKDRKKAGRAVPAKGLYLSRVEYPKSILN